MKFANVSFPNSITLAGLLMASALSLQAKAETIDCTAITSLPYVIATQGVYCLNGNLSTSMTSGNAITINTNNVTIDLNGFKLGGLGAGDDTATNGIYAYQRKNITIKNGIIRGFLFGIFLSDVSPYTASSGHVITNILADQNTYRGITVEGLGATVSHNTVVDTGGSSTAFNEAFGIAVLGPSVKVVNNDISTTTAQSTSAAWGIYLYAADYGLVQNNTVTDTVSPSSSGFAIWISSSTGVFARNNNLANADNGITFATSTGKYFNNLTFDVGTPFSGGTPIGGNNN